MTGNSLLISLPPLSGQKMKSVICILTFVSLNTWIKKHGRKDYKERQVGGLQKGRLQSAIGFGLLSVTEWVTKCDKMIYKVGQGLQRARVLLKGNGTKPAIYTHCLTVQSIIISTFKVLYKKVFLMIGTILSEYIIAGIIRGIFTYTFLINVLPNVLQCHTNENSSFMNS